MKLKNTIILGFLILTLLAIVILVGYDTPSEKALNNISKLTEREDFDDVSLTIYYRHPLLLTVYSWSVDNLTSFSDDKKIVINGKDIENHIDLFKQINKDDLIPVKKTSHINARVYYVFESEKEGKLFDVAMWGDNGSIFVGGLEVEGNDIFLEAIMPFLSEDEKNELDGYLYSWSKRALNNISKVTEREDFDDLRLTIYYMDPHTLPRDPLNVDDLMNDNGVKKIVVNGNDIENHIDLFKQINKDDLIPRINFSRPNARVYYVFESEKEGKLFGVAM